MTNKRPNESDYASHVAYTRALEEYCEWLENDKPFSPDWVNYRQGKMDAAAYCVEEGLPGAVDLAARIRAKLKGIV